MNGTLRILDGDFRPAALVPKWTPMVVQSTVGQTEPNLIVLILSKRELIIGRDNTCDHSLISVEVSRRHARITFEAGLWYIHDLGSTNGLYVQGARLTCSEKVVLEDQFAVAFGPPDKGHFKYTFHADFDPTLLTILGEMTCSICAEYLIAPTSLNCSHVFCAHCIDSWKCEYRSKYNSASNGICPVCREECIWQTPVLPFENIINLVLEKTLIREKLDERRALIEERKNSGTSQSLGYSIVLSSDDSDESDFDVHDEDDDEDFSDEENGNFVEVDYNQESGQVELSLDLPFAVDEGDAIDFSIIVHPSLETVVVVRD